ncbi:C39 family peptidase [Heyndrickxia vini]|uniref:C39 family peptidase n=1 Tax=Heyndrickxia vini TaxID=1476025 RepID=A0ABX7DWQ3_9BACI|nr:C39 family peptidase [Heyndrickxia vini]QQZ07757.1 C39 family peptidase [Heyndrickxia vini]
MNRKLKILPFVILFFVTLYGFKLTALADESSPIINPFNDKDQVITGKAANLTTVEAFVGNQELKLRTYNAETGYFEFYPSSLLKAGKQVKFIFIKDVEQQIVYQKVQAAPAPKKPIVNPISNKSTFLTGSAEPYSTIYITINKKISSIKLINSKSFKMNFDPLKAGTKVSVYVIDKAGRKSETVTVKVSDKIPPADPKITTVTDKSFSIKGTTEARATIFIYKEKKRLAKIKTGASGKFTYMMPLQKGNSSFDIYAIDAAGNKSKTKKVKVKAKKRPTKKVLSAPVVKQFPELARGCEVTSLAMLLGDAGVKVSKMTLASKVKKDPTKYKVKKGKKYFGNPYYGFVGNIYTFKKPGLAVYHGPIASLASKYLPKRIVDLTGSSFDTVKDYVAAGHPVWVITTSWFRYVPSKYWTTWYTPHGKIRITYKEHSVLITGYDKKYVYFNDPMDGKKNRKKPLKQFIEGWKQFGNQAISYY